MTYDFARLMDGATQVSCSGFGQIPIDHICAFLGLTDCLEALSPPCETMGGIFPPTASSTWDPPMNVCLRLCPMLTAALLAWVQSRPGFDPIEPKPYCRSSAPGWTAEQWTTSPLMSPMP